jgi:hypothetical protein
MTTSREKREFNRRQQAGYDEIVAKGPTNQQRSEARQHLAQLELLANGKLRVPDLVMPNGKKLEECSPEYMGQLIATMKVCGIELPKPPEMREFECHDCGKVFQSPRSDEDADAEMRANWGKVPEADQAVICDGCYQKGLARIGRSRH